MKILVHASSSVSPFYDGTTLRTFHITPYLAKNNTLHLIQERWNWEKQSQPLNPAGYDEGWLNQYYSKIINVWHHPSEKLRYGMIWESNELYRTLDQIITQEHYDAIYSQTESFPLYSAKRNLRVTNVITGPTDSAHLHYARDLKNTKNIGRQVRLLAKWSLYTCYQLAVLNRMPFWAMVSDRDINSMKILSPRNEIRLMPNGVDLDYYKLPANMVKDPKQLLFVGTMGLNGTNEKSIIWFLEKVWPLVVKSTPEAKFTIVGRDPSEELERWVKRSVRVNLAGYVKDTRLYYWKAGIFILPMRNGGGVKNKLLEAWAAKCAVISTRIGIEGILNTKDEETAIIVDDPGHMASEILRLIADPDEQDHLATKGNQFVVDHYSWNAAADKLEEYLSFVSQFKRDI